MKKYTFLLALIWFAQAAMAQVTFSEHIAPIIYSHCTTCHRPGEIGPFPLTNYNEVVSYAATIKHVTGIKYMPPFKADVTYQQFQHENVLTQNQIQAISDWVDAGTPQGNPALEPTLPVYPTGSRIGTPDKVISFSQAYTHLGDDQDEYRNFVIPTGLTQDRDLIALEIRPGNNAIVHHALFWEDTTGQAAAADAATPEYGYSGNVTQIVTNGSIDHQLPSYVPGQRPTVLSNAMAYRLHAGGDLLCQFHYAPVTTDQKDSTTFNLFFAQQPAQRYIKSHVMIPFLGTLVNGPFIMPANQVKEFHGTYTMTEEASMVSTMPHMHKLGQSWLVYAITPMGDTIPLIRIGSWDFFWQGNFDFKHLVHVPTGSVIHAFATYDNTTANVNNPNSPPKQVGWGENTTDEMYWLPLQWVTYKQGDESLVLEADTTTGITDSRFYQIQDKLYPVAPNPAKDNIKIGFTLNRENNISLSLYDINGKQVETLVDNKLYLPGQHTKDLNVSQLAAGVYELVLQTKEQRQTQKVVVAK